MSPFSCGLCSSDVREWLQKQFSWNYKLWQSFLWSMKERIYNHWHWPKSQRTVRSTELEGSSDTSCLVWSGLAYPSIMQQVKPWFISDTPQRRVAVRPAGDGVLREQGVLLVCLGQSVWVLWAKANWPLSFISKKRDRDQILSPGSMPERTEHVHQPFCFFVT